MLSDPGPWFLNLAILALWNRKYFVTKDCPELGRMHGLAHQMSATPSSLGFDNQKCLRMLPTYPWDKIVSS